MTGRGWRWCSCWILPAAWAAFNASASGGTNLLGEGELVDDVVSGRVDLPSIDRDRLPAPMQPLAPAEREALIAEMAKHRNPLQREIRDLARQRSRFISKKVEALGGTEDSLDHKIYSAVREQAGKKGLL
jgi:hypothetical protein